MTTAIKRRRGTTAQHSTFTGLEGELTVDTTKDTVVVHDGATAGGFALLREDLSNNTNVASTSTTQTFTNKTINLSSNTLTGTTAQFNTALSDGDFATLAGTETLSNKTFSTNPTISSGTANGVAYLNGSKVLTTGSALTWNGTNLGVGTNNPSSKLDVQGDISIGSGFGLYLHDGTGASYPHITAPAIDSIGFFSSSTEQMRLTSTGLGIGTSSPSYKLNVVSSGNGTNSRFTNGSSIFDIYNGSGTSYIGDAGVNNSIGFTTSNSSITFYTNSGTERMRLDSSGNVGIGTSSPVNSPNYKTLTINGTTGGQIAFQANGTTAAYLYNASTAPFVFYGTGTELARIDSSGNLGLGVTPSAWQAGGNIDGLYNFTWSSYDASIGSNYYYNAGYKYKATGAAVSKYSPYLGAHTWYTAPSGTAGNAISFTQAMTLDASGNLGIGTSSPSDSQSFTRALDLNGPSGAAFYARTAGSATNYMAVGSYGANGYLWNQGTSSMLFYNNGSERMRIDSSGNVGIGTSSPASALDVRAASGVSMFRLTATTGTNAVYSRFENTGGFLYLGRDNSSGTDFGSAYAAGIWSTGAYPMLFGTNGTERMRIDSSGNLLVGRTDATVNTGDTGVVITTGSNYPNGRWYGSTPHTFHQFFLSGTAIGSITGSGSTTAYNTSSDYRLKENIQPMQNALGVVAQLNPVTYTWKADGSDGQGFIAHELQAVVPDCVTGEKDAVDEEGNPIYQGIDTSFLVATLTKAIQELKAELDATKAEVAALKGA